MEKVIQLVNIAATTGEQRFFAQSATSQEYEKFPFGDGKALEIALLANGARVQQNDGKRMLVNFKAWVDVFGVVTPVKTNNL
jgi:hypothetical protein